MKTVYSIIVDGDEEGITENLSAAIRIWDAATYARSGTEGGITVATFDGDTQVRDGWILHVHDGTTYLNPNLQPA